MIHFVHYRWQNTNDCKQFTNVHCIFRILYNIVLCTKHFNICALLKSSILLSTQSQSNASIVLLLTCCFMKIHPVSNMYWKKYASKPEICLNFLLHKTLLKSPLTISRRLRIFSFELKFQNSTNMEIPPQLPGRCTKSTKKFAKTTHFDCLKPNYISFHWILQQ